MGGANHDADAVQKASECRPDDVGGGDDGVDKGDALRALLRAS